MRIGRDPSAAKKKYAKTSVRHLLMPTEHLQALGATIARGAVAKVESGDRRRPKRKPPWPIRARKFYKRCKALYHVSGVKHLCLIGLLIIYQFIGAAIFLFLEESAEETKEMEWEQAVARNRSKIVHLIVPHLFNSSPLLKYLTDDETIDVYQFLGETLKGYEKILGVKYTDQKIKWDFWNAMLYAGTICTTIVLSILENTGKLLTVILKYPWLVVKMICRRLSSHCSGLTKEQIKELDEEDKRNLSIFDLPIPVAIFVVISWILISSATFCFFEKWDYFTAFYFFFISLTTIGLGDIIPQEPKILLMMFMLIIIGLSLVSMCINLIQSHLEQSYADPDHEKITYDKYGHQHHLPPERTYTTRLGLLRRISGSQSSSIRTSPTHLRPMKSIFYEARLANKISQTLITIPPSTSASNFQSNYPSIKTEISVDDVAKLVDNEEGDILVLSELNKNTNGQEFSTKKGDEKMNLEEYDDEELICCRNDQMPSTSRCTTKMIPDSIHQASDDYSANNYRQNTWKRPEKRESFFDKLKQKWNQWSAVSPMPSSGLLLPNKDINCSQSSTSDVLTKVVEEPSSTAYDIVKNADAEGIAVAKKLFKKNLMRATSSMRKKNLQKKSTKNDQELSALPQTADKAVDPMSIIEKDSDEDDDDQQPESLLIDEGDQTPLDPDGCKKNRKQVSRV
uniref:Potassium channel domain-containing protein n=1 Tax=Romanomermis culicivorax TaxID=13658 RepID=A0A915L3P6_ROMCU